MNILIISPGYLVQPAVNGGAVEVLIDTIINENEKFKKANFTVYSIYDGTKLESNKNKLVQYKYIDTTGILYKMKRIIYAVINKIPNIYMGKAYIREVMKAVRKENKNYDAIVIENNPIFSNIVRKYTSTPIIIHLHNDYLNKDVKFACRTLKSATHVLTVSNYIGECVKTIDKNTDKVSTLYNGIDLHTFSNQLSNSRKEILRKKYNLDLNDKVILYTGRIMKEKGVKELIEAFINVRKDISNLKLLIVGSSFYKNSNLSKYQKQLIPLCKKYSDDIIFTGYINHESIWEIYKISDIQIVPSIWGEPLATTVIEGMASNIPLIVNEVGGIPEMVDKHSALFCQTPTLVKDLEKNIRVLLNDSKIGENISKIANEKVQKFEKTIFYENYINKISEIIRKNRNN